MASTLPLSYQSVVCY